MAGRPGGEQWVRVICGDGERADVGWNQPATATVWPASSALFCAWLFRDLRGRVETG